MLAGSRGINIIIFVVPRALWTYTMNCVTRGGGLGVTSVKVEDYNFHGYDSVFFVLRELHIILLRQVHRELVSVLNRSVLCMVCLLYRTHQVNNVIMMRSARRSYIML